MNEYPVGQEITLTLEARDAADVLRDPTAIDLEIILPDKTKLEKTLADLTRVSQGIYELDYVVAQVGRHRCHAEATGAVTVAVNGSFLGTSD